MKFKAEGFPLKTTHRILFESSAKMKSLERESVDLVVTSPPYPMIEMWDGMFCKRNPAVRNVLEKGDGVLAVELMHKELDRTWKECLRVLREGGIACINIGDATRTINGDFRLYANHARILQGLLKLGFSVLPEILWRKQTNAPNKFMGSGMLPAGAYVTLEHEFILVVRKGSKRVFMTAAEKRNRRESALFWEERNVWFSDVWMDIKGTSQDLGDKAARRRSAAFPFEVAHRLINMYSVKGDLVLDPFLGTGTTLAAAAAAGRNSVGFEIDRGFRGTIRSLMKGIVPLANKTIRSRIAGHAAFADQRKKTGKPMKHVNRGYGFPVMTSQEKDLLLNELKSVRALSGDAFEVAYREKPKEQATLFST